jgi:WD40 repeat protein/serine/threonine protein kinase
MTPDHDLTRSAPSDNITRSQGEPPTLSADPAKDQSTLPRTASAGDAIDAPPGFVLERELGEGGMGVVYLARQLGLNRLVALKLVKPSAKVDAKALIRFLAEAEAVAAVRHPNVVEVYQYGEHAGKPYMALEYCPGGDLTGLVSPTRERGTVSREATPSASEQAAWFRRIADLMAKVADGVHAAHALGIVHRDLKPHNVFLANPPGEPAASAARPGEPAALAAWVPKVADFGLAKRGIGSDLTNTEAVMGTPAYMAPEQAGGGTKFVGPEADVWALGVMLYELCCGERPIDTSGPLLDALARVAKGDVSQLRTKAPTVPPDLSLIAHKCLSPDPRDRYPTAGALAADLRNWLDGKPISARPAGVIEQAVKWAKRNKKLAGMGLAVLLTMTLATAVSLGFGLEADKQASEAKREKKNVEDKAEALTAQLTETNRVLDLAKLREAEVAIGADQMDSAAEKLSGIAAQNRCFVWALLNRWTRKEALTMRGHSRDVSGVAYSPDGRRIATNSHGHIVVWDAATGERLSEVRDRGGGGVAFSPDGQQLLPLALGREQPDGCWARVLGTAKGQLLSELNQTQNIAATEKFTVTCVALSPDGRRVFTAGPGDFSLRLWDATSGLTLVIFDGHESVAAAAFSPDSRFVATATADEFFSVRRSSGSASLWDAATGKRLIEFKAGDIPVTSVAFSPDGRRIVTGDALGTARVWEIDLRAPTATYHMGWPSEANLTFSPDSRMISIGFGSPLREITTGQKVSKRESADESEAWRSNYYWNRKRVQRVAKGAEEYVAQVLDDKLKRCLVELPVHSEQVTAGSLSHDEKRAVTGSKDGTAVVWDANTGEKLVTLKGHSAEVTDAVFSPDGRRIATGSSDQSARLWDTVSGQCLLILSEHNSTVGQVAFSADNQKFATVCFDRTVRVWDATPAHGDITFKGPRYVEQFAISPDGQRVATVDRGRYASVWDTASGRMILKVGDWLSSPWSVTFSPDGQRIAIGGNQFIRIFDAATGEEVSGFDSASMCHCLVFSPDGKRLASGCSWVEVWDLATRDRVAVSDSLSGPVTRMEFNADGTKIVTRLGSEEMVMLDSSTGKKVKDGPRPTFVNPTDLLPDGRRVVYQGSEVVIVNSHIEPDELARRRLRARPDPWRHDVLAKKYEKNPFASVVQKSLEQKARGQLAVEAGDIDKAWGHFIAAEVLRPKPVSPEPKK